MSLDVRVGGRYKLGKRIGSGSFGEIHIGIFNIKFVKLKKQQMLRLEKK